MLIENKFTIRSLSREYLLRTFGKVIADEVFPQDRDRGISKESEEITMLIHRVVMSEIQENGYVVVNEIKDKVQEYAGTSTSWTDYKYKQAESEMLVTYGLKKTSLTNDLREQLDITHLKPNARPKILTQI